MTDPTPKPKRTPKKPTRDELIQFATEIAKDDASPYQTKALKLLAGVD